MLRFSKKNLVSLFEEFGAIAKGDEVDRHGRASCEDDLFGLGIQELGEGVSRLGDFLVHVVAKIVIATVGVGGLVGVIIGYGIKDTIRFESGRGIV